MISCTGSLSSSSPPPPLNKERLLPLFSILSSHQSSSCVYELMWAKQYVFSAFFSTGKVMLIIPWNKDWAPQSHTFPSSRRMFGLRPLLVWLEQLSPSTEHDSIIPHREKVNATLSQAPLSYFSLNDFHLYLLNRSLLSRRRRLLLRPSQLPKMLQLPTKILSHTNS